MQRFFRSDEATYEATRLSLDEQFGHPSNVAHTVYDPADVAPRDADGRCYLAVRTEFCEWPQVAAVLPGLLADGVVEEVTQKQYRAVADVAID